jgi:hypothetical protein
MKPSIPIAALATAMMVLTGAAHGASVLERAYSSEKLQTFWAGTLGSAAPEAARFSLLAPGPAAIEPTHNPSQPGSDLPFTGEVIGESATTSGAPRAVGFPVIPLSANDASVLVRRLAWAEIYLSRYRYFAPVSTDSAETLSVLIARQFDAAIEAYLVTARLYFAGADLPEKCRQLTRLNEINIASLSGVAADKLSEAWRPLLPVAEAVRTRLGNDALAKLVCAVKPVRDRAETAKRVETRVREEVITAVRAKVDNTLDMMEASSTEFQALVNEMDVLIRTAEVLELERVLGNAQANMVLVKNDQLKAAETIATLQAVDLSSLNQPDSLKEFEDGKARMTAIAGQIEQVMAALAGLASVVDDPAVSTELASCATLRGAYSALDPSLDTGTLTRAINGPYEDCVNHARTVVARFQNPSLAKAQMAELARHVRQLSEIFLNAGQP